MDVLLRLAPVLLLCLPVSGDTVTTMPPDMSQGVYCYCCASFTKEMDKLLAKKTSDLREVQVVDAMEDICQSKYFKTYDLSPPTTVKVCKFLIDKYEEEIEQLLIKRAEDTEQEICYKLSKACEGVDRSVKPKEPFEYSFNNMRQKVKREPPPPQEDDGIQRMNVDINDPGAAERLADQIKSQLGQQAMGGGEDGDEEDDEEEEEEEEEEGAGVEVTDEEDDTQSFKEKTEL